MNDKGTSQDDSNPAELVTLWKAIDLLRLNDLEVWYHPTEHVLLVGRSRGLMFAIEHVFPDFVTLGKWLFQEFAQERVND